MQLTEKHRPRRLADIIGHDSTVAMLRGMLARGLSSKAFYFIGPTGQGKTSFATALCGELHIDPMNVTQIVGPQCDADFVRKLSDDLHHSSLFDTGDGWHAVIIDEAHSMSRQAVQLWLGLLEHLPEKRLIVFTSNTSLEAYGEFSAALFSRCSVFGLELDCEQAAQHLAKIATNENLNGQELDAYRALLKRCGFNVRWALQEIGNGKMLAPSAPASRADVMTEIKQTKAAGELEAELAYGRKLFAGSKKHKKHLERLAALKSLLAGAC